MSGEFLSHTLAPPRPTRSRWTIVGSFVIHGALVVGILILPALGALTLPSFDRPLTAVFAESVPVPPTPAPPRPTLSSPPTPIAPLKAPNGFAPDKPPSGVVALPGVPGGMDVPGGGSGRLADLLERGTTPEYIPPKQAPVRPGGDIRAPQRVQYVAPVYPTLAREIRREGTVILEAVIDETGAVRNVIVLRSIPQLDRAAIDAVNQWRYTPTRLNGVPVAIIMTVTVTFSLR